MTKSISRKEGDPNDPIGSLQKEIAALEAEFSQVKTALGAFEAQIHRRLDRQIARVRELAELYKRQKKEKKAKRLEQKKRGKNYKEPTALKPAIKSRAGESDLNVEEQAALKRLYKEAVVQVHPDKFIHAGEQDKIQRANAITAQLNGIYKRGDLEELINFYQYVILGHEVPQEGLGGEQLVDVKVRQESLRRKKELLQKQLADMKSSYTYNVLLTYENPLSFIDELYLQFEDRIRQLEKRTRKG